MMFRWGAANLGILLWLLPMAAVGREADSLPDRVLEPIAPDGRMVLLEELPIVPRYELATPGFESAQLPRKAGSDLQLSLVDVPVSTSVSQPAAPADGEARAIDLSLEGVDYNLPDPNRGVANHFQALGGVVFANYVNWQFAWLFMDMAFVTHDSIARNLEIGFIWDDNELSTNFYRHPYQGSMYYHSARAAGLTFLESSLYTAFGSLQWEFMGETHPPAPNDVYTTVLGGMALGEVLYRLSSEVLDDSTSGSERFWRELGAAVISPMRGFQRLTSGQAFAHGPPHESRQDLEVQLHFGLEHVRGSDLENADGYDPTFLLGLKLDYGDQLPAGSDGTFDAYDFFDIYLSANLFNSELSGGRLFSHAVVHGWNQWLSDPEETHPDNTIVGFSQSFDYANANLFELGGVGVGVANWTNWRFADEVDFRLTADIGWQAMSAATSPFTQVTGRSYNFGMGLYGLLRGRLRIDRYGELNLFGKQYVVSVVDGSDGSELYGLLRATYEVPVYHGLGLGLGPLWAYRIGKYDAEGTVEGDTFELQGYLLWNI